MKGVGKAGGYKHISRKIGPSKLRDFFTEIIFKVTLVAVLALGALFFYAALPPSLQKISVEGLPLDPKDSSEATFTVKNTGVLPVFDLQCFYTIATLQTEDGLRGSAGEAPLFFESKTSAWLWPDEKQEVKATIKKLNTSPPSFVDMSITVRYKPVSKLSFYKREQSFRFMTAKKKNGLLGWYVQPQKKGFNLAGRSSEVANAK